MASLEEEGAYIRLLCFAWREGWIPSCPKRCAVLIGKGATEMLARVVQGWFNQHPDDAEKMIHLRLEAERQKQLKWREKSAEGGRKSASKRGSNRVNGHSENGSRVVEEWLQPKGNSSSSSSEYNTPSSENAESTPKNGAERKLKIPSSLSSVNGFRAAWVAFVDHRRVLRSKMTLYAAEIILNRLASRPEDSVEALNMAIECGWKTVKWEWFDDRKKAKGKPFGKSSDVNSEDHNPL